MVSSIKNYVIIGLFAALSVVGFMWRGAELEVTELDAKLKMEQMYSSSLYQEISAANKELSRQREVAASLRITVGGLEDQLTSKVKEINQYKGRQAVVYAKPGLVEKLEQKALDEFFNGVADED